MDLKYYRSTINNIPQDQSKVKNSGIPLFFTVDFENDNLKAPVIVDSLVRCEKCKAYLNPYVEIIMPGLKWKCNLCERINDVECAFQMSERKTNENPHNPVRNSEFNRTYFVREDLRHDVYEIEAPDSFVLKTPDSPILCFVIDVSLESQKLAISSSVLSLIKEILQNIEYDPRTKVCFMFYDENCYILNNNNTFTAICGEIPMLLGERMLFPLTSFLESIDFNKIDQYFSNKKSPNMNILLPLKIAIQAFRSASIFTFASTMPNFGSSSIKPSQNLVCTNSEYKSVAESLFRKNLCVNLFIMARSNVEFSTIRILSQHTGGQSFHYSNYDGTDPVYSAKLYADMTEYFNKNIGFSAVCRIRANEGVIIKNIYGNFCQKSSDLIGFSNYSPSHMINFSLSMFNDVKGALYVQIAMIRISKMGKRLIRVFNICIPVENTSFYINCDSHAISQALLLESFSMEWQKSGEFINKKLMSIWREIRDYNGSLPQNFTILPQLILSARKSIALRPDLNTPTDFRSFYLYLFSNMNQKIFDLMIYPILLNISDSNVESLPLSMQSINPSCLYIMDAGVSIFFYVGKNCDRSLFEHLFGTSRSGPILFNPPGESEFSKYVGDLLVYLQQNRSLTPKYLLVDESENSVYNSIFFSYMFNDRIFGLPGIEEYLKELNSIFS